jgi:hypothetical protein
LPTGVGSIDQSIAVIAYTVQELVSHELGFYAQTRELEI